MSNPTPPDTDATGSVWLSILRAHVRMLDTMEMLVDDGGVVIAASSPMEALFDGYEGLTGKQIAEFFPLPMRKNGRWVSAFSLESEAPSMVTVNGEQHFVRIEALPASLEAEACYRVRLDLAEPDDSSPETNSVGSHAIVDEDGAPVTQNSVDLIQQQRTRLEIAQSCGEIGIWEIDLTDGSVWWSAEKFRLYGYEPDEVIPSRELTDKHIHPDDVAKVAEAVEASTRTGELFTVDYRIRRKDGEEIVLNTRGKAVANEFGEPVLLSGVSHDVTAERTLLQQALLTERRLNDAEKLGQVGSWEYDLATGAVWWSEGHYQLFGYEPYEIEVTASTVIEHVLEDDRNALVSSYYDIRDKEVVASFRIRKKDGSIARLESRGTAIWDKDGNIIRLRGSVRDVTEMSLTISHLHRKEDRLRDAQKVGEFGIWRWEIGSSDVHWTPESFEVFGLEPREGTIRLDTIMSMIRDEDQEKLREKMASCADTGEPYDIQFRVIKPDGVEAFLVGRGARLYDEFEDKTFLTGTVHDVTAETMRQRERVRYQQRLAESQHMAKIGSWDWDLKNNDIWWSDELYRMFGYRYGEISPQPETFFEHIEAEDMKMLADVNLASRVPGETDQRVYRCRDVRGNRLMILARSRILYDEHGVPARFWGTFQDVTESHQRELALEAYRQRLEEAQRVGKVGFWEWNVDTGTLWWSEATHEIFGISRDVTPSYELFQSVIEPHDVPHISEGLQRTLETGEKFEEQFTVILPSSERRRITGSGTISKDPETGHRIIRGTNHDVTDIVGVYAEMERTKLRLEEAERIGQFGSFEIDIETGQMWWSDEAYRLHGMLPQEMDVSLDMVIANIFEDDQDNVRAKLVETIQRGKPYEAEYRAYLDVETLGYFVSKGEVLENPVTGSRYLVGTIHNITDRKSIENQLAEALEAKDRFLASISHEVRTPLNGIVGMSEMLGFTHLNDEQRRYQRLLKISAQILTELVEDILDFSKLEYGTFRIEEVTFSPKQLLVEIAELFKDRYDSKGVILTTDAPNLDDFDVSGARLRIRQIVTNYLSNALKFTPEGGHVDVVASLEPKTKADAPSILRIEVSDTGCGIPQHRLIDIFRPFSQLDSSEDNPTGTGLGLAISRRLAKMMSGAVGVMSEPSKGSTFWLEIPVKNVSSRHCTNRSETPKPKVRAQCSRDSDGVLIVEDNLTSRFILEQLVQRLGLRSQSFETGKEALHALKSQRWCIAFVDIMLPDMKSYDMVSAFRKWERASRRERLPIVATTGLIAPEDIQDCLDAGFDDHLEKPISAERVNAFFVSTPGKTPSSNN